VLEHVPGKNHTAADTLSRPPGCNEGKDDNRDIQMLSESAFIRVMNKDSSGSLENLHHKKCKFFILNYMVRYCSPLSPSPPCFQPTMYRKNPTSHLGNV
jgi:hypothetical protein